jgi:hypothetical protein
MAESTVDQMVLEVRRSPDGSIVEFSTSCSGHGEHSYDIPVDHLIVLSQAMIGIAVEVLGPADAMAEVADAGAAIASQFSTARANRRGHRPLGDTELAALRIALQQGAKGEH